jgi:putative PIN family toxin of toxin-antitoxin system
MDPLRLVLDTNVVVDWLVFDHPFLHPFRESVRKGTVVVLTNTLAIDELARVLDYPMLRLDAARRQQVLRAYLEQTQPVEMPAGFGADALLLPPKFPRCRDPDDDRFLALAFHGRATALVSRDNELLKLQKRARKFGLSILDVPQMTALVGA